MRAYVLTCEERAEVCADTAEALAQTDWGAPPPWWSTRARATRELQRIVDPGLQTLLRPSTRPTSSSTTRSAPTGTVGPVADRRRDGHRFGSDGSQGTVMTVTAARSLVEQWDDGDPLDLRISRLVARWSPLRYHLPPLVQHRPVESTWGGAPHTAIDFSRDWRA